MGVVVDVLHWYCQNLDDVLGENHTTSLVHNEDCHSQKSRNTSPLQI